MKDVSIRQIRAFLAVAATRNFAKAATNLNVSASALSLTIQDLEQRVGVRLFDRTTRTVALTATGAAFLPVADRLTGEFARAIDDLAHFPTRQKGRVSVGAAASIITLLLGPAIADLYEANSAISVHLVEDTTQALASRVIHGELDFGITTLWTKIDALAATPLLDDRLGVLTMPGCALGATDTPLPWSDLRGQNLVSLLSGAGIRARMERDARIGDVLDQPSHEVSSVSALAALVRAGVGSAVVPALTAASLGAEHFLFRPLIRPVSWRNIFLVMSPGRPSTPAAELLQRSIRQRLDDLSSITYVRTQL